MTTQLARWVSILAHPFVMAALLVAVAAARQPASHAIQSVLLVVLAVVVPIALLMFRQVRRGRWSNVDASNPSERPVLFMVALGGMVAALVWLLLRDPRSFLVRGLLVTAGFLLVAALLTRWVKLSLHVAFAALTATALCLLGSSVGYALIVVVPIVFWSRIVLARHHVHELLAGLVLGVITGVALVRL
jgi:membrane-associated phospholipid phosphatase